MVSKYTASVYCLGLFVYTTSTNNVSRPFSKKSSHRRNFEFLIKTPLEKMQNFSTSFDCVSWVNPFGKMQIFRLCENDIFIV